MVHSQLAACFRVWMASLLLGSCRPFVPSVRTTRRFLPLVQFQQGEDQGVSTTVFPSQDLVVGTKPPSLVTPTSDTTETKKIVLPASYSTPVESPKKVSSRLESLKKAAWKKYTNFSWLKKQRPGTRFRVRLGLVAMAGISLASLLMPGMKLVSVANAWLTHRGFQGVSALGRSVAYCWALFVGYPRLLDRRAKERRQRERERALERRRDELTRMAAEVGRLRQELSNLDAEIRAFRREIISMKAAASLASTSGDHHPAPEIQEAIAAELAHLAGLRSDTQAALVAARQTWAEARAQSPSEAWEVPSLGHSAF